MRARDRIGLMTTQRTCQTRQKAPRWTSLAPQGCRDLLCQRRRHRFAAAANGTCTQLLGRKRAGDHLPLALGHRGAQAGTPTRSRLRCVPRRYRAARTQPETAQPHTARKLRLNLTQTLDRVTLAPKRHGETARLRVQRTRPMKASPSAERYHKYRKRLHQGASGPERDRRAATRLLHIRFAP